MAARTTTMNRLSSLPRVLQAVLLLAPLALSAADARVKLDWTDPEKFTDTRQSMCSSTIGPDEWLGELARHVESRAAKQIEPGQHLAITITDVRRAGQCEPWRGPQASDVRIVKEPHSPRIDLRYVLSDADGKVLREGTGELRDLAFLQRGTLNANDPLRFEKRMLDDWLHKTFPAHAP
ncbi:MAG: DUF3016 domain-containing protein [Lysobacteraceae bacterium]|nr:MAG: DUF3016 domain-containing protein [Xanthomonadaceae bacterium]